LTITTIEKRQLPVLNCTQQLTIINKRNDEDVLRWRCHDAARDVGTWTVVCTQQNTQCQMKTHKRHHLNGTRRDADIDNN